MLAKQKSKDKFEEWYGRKDPWSFNNTIIDLVRRNIFLFHVDYAFRKTKITDVLDVGCGEGYLTNDLARKYDVNIDAFDISENAINYAKQGCCLGNINYYTQDLRDLESNNRYDLIVCEEALYYLNDEERRDAIITFGKALKDRSYMKLSVVIVRENQNKNYFTLDEITGLLANNGFEIISMYPSVLREKSLIVRVLFRLLGAMYETTKIGAIIDILKYITIMHPLDNCYQISILSKKFYDKGNC